MFTNPNSLPARRAFTLIELLIVVAIIAILAAIALPNFLEAQTRAKVSRSMADMRSIASALEAYFVDYNAYPRGGPNKTDPLFAQGNYTPLTRRMTPITTPVAYISTLPKDAFPATRGSMGLESWQIDTYDYYDWISDQEEDGAGLGEPPQGVNSTRKSMWRLAGAGPDLFQAFGIVRGRTDEPDGVDYDPTNGTMSWGDIIRTGAGYVSSAK